MKLLTEGVEEISRGNYAHRIPVPSPDEIGYLTKKFNTMAEGLEEKELIRATFGRYVSPEVAEEVLAGKIALGGEEREVTILFSDLRGFTSFSSTVLPQELVSFLNEYFTAMERCIREQGGWINKYLGDGILAVFGAPNSLENSARAAVHAGYAMMEELEKLNASRDVQHHAGIGIHTGNVIVGNIGSQDRAEYTCIGDPVNVASRIQGLTKTYGVPLLVSEETSGKLCESEFQPVLVDRVRLLGKSDATTCYIPYRKRRHEGLPMSDAEYHRFLSLYFSGKFTEALDAIDASLVEMCGKHVQVLYERCRTFSQDPPSNWDGVSRQEMK